MWVLQDALENDPNVGSVLSLPVLMAEGMRQPLAFMLNWESLLMWMEKPKYNKIAKSFITEDHVSGHFILRMKESAPRDSRIEVVDRIKGIVRENGFITEMIGGLYLLQGEMANLVASSLVFGLGRLIIFFFIIAYVVSRSFRISLAMVLGLGIVPISMNNPSIPAATPDLPSTSRYCRAPPLGSALGMPYLRIECVRSKTTG